MRDGPGGARAELVQSLARHRHGRRRKHSSLPQGRFLLCRKILAEGVDDAIAICMALQLAERSNFELLGWLWVSEGEVLSEF